MALRGCQPDGQRPYVELWRYLVGGQELDPMPGMILD